MQGAQTATDTILPGVRQITDEYATNALSRAFTSLQGLYNRLGVAPFFQLGTARSSRALYERVKGWDFDTIMTCHTAFITRDAKQAFLEGYKHLASL
jgi:hypothetical protein